MRYTEEVRFNIKSFFKNHPLLFQITEFILFTLVNGVVQWGIFFLFVFFTDSAMWVMIGFAVSQVASAIVSFLTNRKVTFKSNTTKLLVFVHIMFYVVMIAWQTPVMGILYNHGLNEYLGNLLAGMVFAFFEFIFMKFILFRMKEKSPEILQNSETCDIIKT